MASIRKRGKSWQAEVRSRKTGSIGKSFHHKADAERWTIEQEALMQTGQFEQIQTLDLNLADLMHSHAKKVTPTKRGAAQEFRRISRLLKERDLMLTPLSLAKPHIFAAFRDRRLRAAFEPANMIWFCYVTRNMARVEWGWPLGDNPLSLIRMPKNNPPRERRLRTGEYEALRDAADQSMSWYLLANSRYRN